jgi:hypothetical protein
VQFWDWTDLVAIVICFFLSPTPLPLESLKFLLQVDNNNNNKEEEEEEEMNKQER